MARTYSTVVVLVFYISQNLGQLIPCTSLKKIKQLCLEEGVLNRDKKNCQKHPGWGLLQFCDLRDETLTPIKILCTLNLQPQDFLLG